MNVLVEVKGGLSSVLAADCTCVGVEELTLDDVDDGGVSVDVVMAG